MVTRKFHYLTACLMLALSFPAFAQQTPPLEVELNNYILNCEMSLLVQDTTAMAAVEKTMGDQVLIVIVRPGDGEASRQLIRRRLYNIRQYFRERGDQLLKDRVVVAEGERVKGFGRIEYYIKGKLYQQLLFPKNGYVCHSCCGPDTGYYPDKPIPKSQKQKRKQAS